MGTYPKLTIIENAQIFTQTLVMTKGGREDPHRDSVKQSVKYTWKPPKKLN